MHVRMCCELRSWLDIWDIPEVLQYLRLDLCWIEERIFRYQPVRFMVRKFHWKLTMNGNLRNLNFPPIYYTMVSNLLLSYYFIVLLYFIYYFILTTTIRCILCNNFGAPLKISIYYILHLHLLLLTSIYCSLHNNYQAYVIESESSYDNINNIEKFFDSIEAYLTAWMVIAYGTALQIYFHIETLY